MTWPPERLLFWFRTVRLTAGLIIIFPIIFFPHLAHAQTSSISVSALVIKIAPGEGLPISVKLLNFGSSRRVDVALTYDITTALGAVIYSAYETVAVETTASFVKTVVIPPDAPPGSYIAKTTLLYPDQVTPAISQFSFTIERKIFGIFQSDFYVYAGSTVIFSIVAGLIGFRWMRRRQNFRLTPLSYKNIGQRERIYYELISDTIAQMRQHAGDRALKIAMCIDGLVVDPDEGRVLQIKKNPAKIMARLIRDYQNILGRKVNFALRKPGGKPKRITGKTGKNIVVSTT